MNELEQLRRSLANPAQGTSTGREGIGPLSPTPLRFNQPPVEASRVTHKTQFSSPSTPCQLKASLVTVGGVQKVQFVWGTINGRQPIGFAAGGVPPFQLDATNGNFYYVKAVADMDNLQWVSGQILSGDSVPNNTANTVYVALTSISSGGVLAPSVCGPINTSFCDTNPDPDS